MIETVINLFKVNTSWEKLWKTTIVRAAPRFMIPDGSGIVCAQFMKELERKPLNSRIYIRCALPSVAGNL